MKFFAFVKPKSQLDRRWRGISMQAGLHLGVVFRRNDQIGRYETDELDADQVARIKGIHSQDIILEALYALPEAQSPLSVNPPPLP